MTSYKQWFEVVVYTVYGDESADETKQRVFAVAGLLGQRSEWNIFRSKWKNLTGSMVFHASDCDTDSGEFKSRSHQENKALYKALTQLISESPLLGYGVAINLADYNHLICGKIDENPYYLCFQSVVTYLARRGSVCIPRNSIEFIFDRNHQVEYNAGQLYDHMMNITDWGSEYKVLMQDKVSFATNKTIGIQAADLLARETMKFLDNRIGPKVRSKRAAIESLQRNNRIAFRIYDRAFFDMLIRESRGHRYLTDDYYKWLESRGLTNNLTNRLKYQSSSQYKVFDG